MSSVEALSRLPVFRGVAPEALGALLELGELRRYPARVVVFAQGAPADGATLLIQGRLEVLVQTDGGITPVGWVHPGEITGEQGLFVSGGVRNATVRAAQESLCLDLTLRLLQEGRDNPALAALEQHLIAALARRIRSTNLAIQKAWKEEQQQQVLPPSLSGTPGGEVAPRRSGTSFRERLLSLFGGGMG